jgi:hypothetical protein
MLIIMRIWGHWTAGAAEEGTGGRVVHPGIIINTSEVT